MTVDYEGQRMDQALAVLKTRLQRLELSADDVLLCIDVLPSWVAQFADGVRKASEEEAQHLEEEAQALEEDCRRLSLALEESQSIIRQLQER